MPNQIFAFSLPKIGETDKNIQDRFNISLDDSQIALADGAGSSLYPSKWAEILVEYFCADRENAIDKIRTSHQEWLKSPQEQWREYYLAKLTNPNRPWWQKGSQLKNCGSATFLGLNLSNNNDQQAKKWQAVAVGDSCLFKLDNTTDNLTVFPLNNSQDFKSTTPCWSSLAEYPSGLPLFQEGWYARGDIFLLATDALSHWILADYENRSPEWKKIFQLEKMADFVGIIEGLRQKNLIKNDDTTAVLIKVLD